MNEIQQNVTLYTGFIKEDGTFTTSGTYHSRYVRTDYTDVRGCNSITAWISTANTTISYVALYDANKTFIRYINTGSNSGKYTYNIESGVAYVVFDAGGDTSVTTATTKINLILSDLLQGYLNTDGTINAGSNSGGLNRTDYLDVSNCSSITVTAIGTTLRSYALYDSNKTFIRYTTLGGVTEKTYIVEDGVAYIIFDFGKSGDWTAPSDIDATITLVELENNRIKNIIIGDTVIQTVYLGNVKITKIYLGSMTIFDNN